MMLLNIRSFLQVQLALNPRRRTSLTKISLLAALVRRNNLCCIAAERIAHGAWALSRPFPDMEKQVQPNGII